jgi:hypothetical protein
MIVSLKNKKMIIVYKLHHELLRDKEHLFRSLSLFYFAPKTYILNNMFDEVLKYIWTKDSFL